MPQWYYAVDGQPAGPADDAAIAQMVQSGQLNMSSPLTEVGSSSWGTVADFAAQLGLGGGAAPVAPSYEAPSAPSAPSWEAPATTATPSWDAAPPTQAAVPGFGAPQAPQTPGFEAPGAPSWGAPAAPQQPAWGAPDPNAAFGAPGGYPQQPGYGAPMGVGGMAGAQADLGKRFVAYLIDAGITVGLYIAGIILTAILGAVADSLAILGLLVTWAGILGFQIWNLIIVQGKTGQSIGKKQQKIKLIADATGQPLGSGNAFIRWLLGGVLGSICFLDFFFLFSAEKKRLSDKILNNSVVNA